MIAQKKQKLVNLYRNSKYNIKVLGVPRSNLIGKKIRIDERILRIDQKREQELRDKLLELVTANHERALKIKRLREAREMQRLREQERRRMALKIKEEMRRLKAEKKDKKEKRK